MEGPIWVTAWGRARADQSHMAAEGQIGVEVHAEQLTSQVKGPCDPDVDHAHLKAVTGLVAKETGGGPSFWPVPVAFHSPRTRP